VEAPYTRRRAAQFYGPTTSDDYNKRIEENYKDLVSLVNRARLSEVELDELYRRMVKDQLSLARIIDHLEERIEAMEANEKRLTFHSATQIDNERFNGTDFEVPEEDRLSIDLQHGLLTLPVVSTSSFSKLFYTTSDGREVIPSSLETRVVGNVDTADNTTAFIDTSDPEFALYRRPGLIWERNVVVEAPHEDGAELTLYLKAPTDLFTTPNSNCILIHPFPFFGTTINEISYSTKVEPQLRESDGYIQFNEEGHYANTTDANRARNWVIPGGWQGNYEGEDAAVDVGPKKYYFSPKPITALRIKLSRKDHYAEAGRYIYTYGLSRLDLRQEKFLPEGRAIIRFDAPDGQVINNVDYWDGIQAGIWNVDPVSLGGGFNTDPVYEYRFIWETSANSGIYTTEVPVTGANRMWVEVTLKNTEGWTPALSDLVIDYS